MRDYRKKIDDIIARDGWVVQGVFPTAQDDDQSTFAYTIGLFTAGLPELLISGNLGFPTLQALLNTAARYHLGTEIKPGAVLDELANHPMKAIACDEREVPVGMAKNYYQGRIPVIQLLWPDTKGVYPDSVFYNHSFAQPTYPKKA